MSLRLAIKRSLEQPADPSTSIDPPLPHSSSAIPPSPPESSATDGNGNNNNMAMMKKERTPSSSSATTGNNNANNGGRIPRRRARRPPVILPTITKCIRNANPADIDTHGFVEIKRALSKRLIDEIHREAVEKVNRHEMMKARDNGELITSSSSSSSSPGGGSGSKRKKQSPTTASGNNNGGGGNNDVPEVEEISNALQVDVSDALLQKIQTSFQRYEPARKTMEVVYGKCARPKPKHNNFHHDKHHHNQSSSSHPVQTPTRHHHHNNNIEATTESNYDGYVLETPKVLVTPPGSNPQLPHADDFCTSCLICLVHLRPNQEPTRIHAYDNAKDYPTGITVTCDDCNRKEQLPDADYRRGVHLTDEAWHCHCHGPWTPYDFEGKLTKCFGELLDEDAPQLCDSYCGSPDETGAGDGMLALPTLIHCGPGNATSSETSRYVLFFTLRPCYKNAKEENSGGGDTTSGGGGGIGGGGHGYHRYNPQLQVHASCILFNQFKRVKLIYERAGCGLEGYFNAIVGMESGRLMNEVLELKEENRLLRRKVARMESKKGMRDGKEEEERKRRKDGKKKKTMAAAVKKKKDDDKKKLG